MLGVAWYRLLLVAVLTAVMEVAGVGAFAWDMKAGTGAEAVAGGKALRVAQVSSPHRWSSWFCQL